VRVEVDNAAAAKDDKIAPEAITGFRSAQITASAIRFQWNTAADNVGTAKYIIYKDGNEAGTVAASARIPEFSDSGLKPATLYSYQVAAVDAAGNAGPRSAPLALTTKAKDGRTLTVGPNGKYRTPCAALNAAAAWDTVEIDAAGGAVYEGDVCSFRVDNLTIRGVNGRPAIAAGGKAAGEKAIWVIAGTNNLVENVEMSGAAVGDNNGAAIRAEGRDLTLRSVYFHDNQDGVLAAYDVGGQILVEYSEFAYNGAGDGLSHNLYIANVDRFIMRYSYSHDAKAGHLLKSRAKENHILYNRFTDEHGTASYETDLPDGGPSYLVGNIFQQSPGASNTNILEYGSEGKGRDRHLYIVNNTFVNDYPEKGSVCFLINSADSTVLMQNNLFFGAPCLASHMGGVTKAGNLMLAKPLFRDVRRYDFHVGGASGAAGAGKRVGNEGGGKSVAAVYEYVHPASGRERAPASLGDAGAFQVADPPPVKTRN
jgi:hypothetical protein